MKAAGDLFGGAAQGKMAEYQAGLARQRSQIEEQNARFAESAGESQALRSGMGTRVRLADLSLGQSNIALAGSRALARKGATEVGQMEEANIRTNTARQVFGFQEKSAQEVAQANIYSTASATARTASYLGAATDVVGAIGQAAMSASPGSGSVNPKWLQASQNTQTIGG
jgi:hypothetical protein